MRNGVGRQCHGDSEYLMCFTYEKDQETDECCGASGRKFRQVCMYCPNNERWRQRKEKEEINHGNESEDNH